jgi:hypothetical protein
MEDEIQLAARHDETRGATPVHATTKAADIEAGPGLRPHPRDGWSPWKWKGFVVISVVMVLTGGKLYTCCGSASARMNGANMFF